MNSKYSTLFFLPLAFSAVVAGQDSAAQHGAQPPQAHTVIVVPVSGTVNAAMAAFIGRAIRESGKYRDRTIVLELDTYGGEVDAAFRIVDTMLSIRDCPTIAYVKTKAISAGALIALSCQKLYMQSHTTLGDVAPLMESNEGPKMLGEKFQAPIRAKFRILARQNNYPMRLTEAMVTAGVSVYEVTLPDTTLFLDSAGIADLAPARRAAIRATRTAVKGGELLTMDDIEAKQLRFSRMTVSGLDEALRHAGLSTGLSTGLSAATVIRYQESWSEKFVKLIGLLAPLLMTIGVGLLYIEFKHPGLVLPAVIGVICLALVFFGQYMVGLANYTDILLAVVGIMLVAIEIFVFPTGGLLAVGGVGLLIVSLVLSLQGFAVPRPEFPWQMRIFVVNLAKVIGSFVIAGGIAFLFVKYGIPRLGMVVKGPYLTDALTDTHADSGLGISVAVGDAGTVVTALRPAGRVRVKGEEYTVVSNGEFIEKGRTVTVFQVQGTRIVVVPERRV
jgi:membrane-bound serine protease (ClpP class)